MLGLRDDGESSVSPRPQTKKPQLPALRIRSEGILDVDASEEVVDGMYNVQCLNTRDL